MTRQIRINGRAELVEAERLIDLLGTLGIELPARGLAVAVNGTVMPQSSWSTAPLEAGDDVEIVRARAGG